MPPELICATCHGVAPADTLHWRCACGGLFDLRLKATFPRKAIRNRPPSLWRYREALPLHTECEMVTLGEPVTPLLSWPAIPGSHLKLEFLLPLFKTYAQEKKIISRLDRSQILCKP